MWTDIFLSMLAVAGAAVLWRTLLVDLNWLREGVHGFLPKPVAKALTCGLCFTYWFSLAFVIVFDPLDGWVPSLRLGLPSGPESLLSFLFSWMVISIGAVTIRFAYVAIQEVVYYQTHVIRSDHKH